MFIVCLLSFILWSDDWTHVVLPMCLIQKNLMSVYLYSVWINIKWVCNLFTCSGSVSSEGAGSHDTGDTRDTGPSVSTVTGTQLPLVFVSAFQDEQQRHKVETLPKVCYDVTLLDITWPIALLGMRTDDYLETRSGLGQAFEVRNKYMNISWITVISSL